MFREAVATYSGRIDPSDLNTTWTKIVNLVRDGSRVLDAGCSEGYLAAALARDKRCEVTGIDIEPRAARVAAAYCSSVVVADIEDGALEQLSGPYDVVIYADVLEHLRYPGTVLRATRRLLAPDGYVLVSLPNVAHWQVRRALLSGRFDYVDAGLLDRTHLRFFTYDTALSLFSSSGYRVAHFDLVHRCPLWWQLRRLYRLFGPHANRLVKAYLRGLFGYQFIFKLVPHPAAACMPLDRDAPQRNSAREALEPMSPSPNSGRGLCSAENDGQFGGASNA